MRALVLFSILAGMFLAVPATAEDCFIRSQAMIVADGATEGYPDVFAVALESGSVWDVHPDNIHIARDGIREGHYVQICRKWGSLHMKVRNTGVQFVVLQREGMRVRRGR